MAEGNHTIHVEGIPFSWTNDELKSFFDECGTISSVRMPTWQDTGRSKGYGFLSFSSAEAAAAALKKDKAEVEGRWLKVSEARESNQGERGERPERSSSHFSSTPEDDCKTLFVKNLPYDATEDSIGELFQDHGEVESVRIANENGRSKGFCYIEFAESKSVKSVADATTGGQTWSLSGRNLTLDYGSGKPKAGFHPRKESYESRFGNAHRDINKRGGKGKGKGKGFGKGFGKGKGKGRSKGGRY